jgi:hypothetical protein
MDFLATDGARVVTLLVLSGIVIFDVIWEWWRR